MTKKERELLKEALKLFSEGMNQSALRILRQLRDAGEQAGPSHEREDVGVGQDKTQIVDFITMRLEAA